MGLLAGCRVPRGSIPRRMTMRRTVIVGTFAMCVLLCGPWDAMAVSDAEFDALKRRLDAVEKELSDVKKHESDEGGLKTKKDSEPGLSFGSTGSGKLIYAKPFVSAPKTTVGGYMDFQYRTFKNSSIGTGNTLNGVNTNTSSSFDQQRFVPCFYSDITDRLKVAAELEIEHGVRSKSNSGSGIEVSLEFATVDYLIKEPVNLRAGIILLPLGKFNLLHDSPLNDLSDRPLVATAIIPSTLSETGAGFYGTFYPSRLSKLDYEVYATQGFNGYLKNRTPVITAGEGLRDARQRVSTVDDGLDNNNGKAAVGRIAFSQILGIEVGGSGYYGMYDPASKRPLSIWAADLTFQRGAFELIGEADWVYIRHSSEDLNGNPFIDPTSPAGHLLPQRMDGYYAQGNYHFMPQFLRRWAPSYFTEASTF